MSYEKINSLLLIVYAFTSINNCSFIDQLESLSHELDTVGQAIVGATSTTKGYKQWIPRDCFYQTVGLYSIFNLKLGCDFFKDAHPRLIGTVSYDRKIFNAGRLVELVDELFFGSNPLNDEALSVYRLFYIANTPKKETISNFIESMIRGIVRSHELMIKKMYAMELIVLMLYEESLHPGIWNADYSKDIEEQDMKNLWQQAIESFKKIAREEGCPNY